MRTKGSKGVSGKSSSLQTPGSNMQKRTFDRMKTRLQTLPHLTCVTGLSLALLCSACKSDHPKYSVLNTSPASSVVADSAAGQPGAVAPDNIPLDKFQAVSLPRKLDPNWLQPPSDLYT